jgi:ribosomal protein S18 acetylase RimI-like enzyme
MTASPLPVLRLAGTSDANLLSDIEAACFAEGYADKMMSLEDFQETLGAGTDKVIVAEIQGTIAGYALLLVRAADKEGDFDSLAVAPSQQGKGIGEVLFRAVEAECINSGLKRLNLEIREDNYSLLKRYHRFGYKCFEIEEGFYADGAGAIRMYKVFV